jgi:C4-dicarboxylate-specific signal transduction histidine kinase
MAAVQSLPTREPPEKPEAELRRCLRDLVALSSLPIIWVGANAEQIANALAQLIVSVLDVEFAWVTIKKPAVNVFQAHNRTTQTELVPRTPKSDWVKPNARFATNSELQRQMYGASVPIGLEPGSVLVALCCRSKFPTETEHLLLRVAANQAAVAIQQWRTEQSLRSEMRQREALEAREREQRSREMQRELAHANRVATMGQLTASIAHEVKQPIAATVINARAARRFLGAQSVDLDEVRTILDTIMRDGNRAGEVIDRIRALVRKAPPRKDRLEINEAIREVLEFTRGEAMKNGVTVQTALADDLPLIEGDRVELQQVMLNLVINAIEAMSGTSEGSRELLISSCKAESGGVLVAVRDSGPGLGPATLDRVFDAFYTTKGSGMGMGLSICRSIIEAHDGRLWASANEPHGAVFEFTVPALRAVAS